MSENKRELKIHSKVADILFIFPLFVSFLAASLLTGEWCYYLLLVSGLPESLKTQNVVLSWTAVGILLHCLLVWEKMRKEYPEEGKK